MEIKKLAQKNSVKLDRHVVFTGMVSYPGVTTILRITTKIKKVHNF